MSLINGDLIIFMVFNKGVSLNGFTLDRSLTSKDRLVVVTWGLIMTLINVWFIILFLKQAMFVKA